VICLYSGGKDSHLAACLLVKEGYRVHLVTFENGAGMAGKNAEHGAKRMIERFGDDAVKYLGLYSTVSFWREFFLPFFNMKPVEIQQEFGQITISQFNCLSCRSAMYVVAIKLADQHQITAIADGARSIQGFVIELPCMIEQFKSFLNEYGLEFLYPVLELENDWRLKNLLLSYGFVPKTIEPQCLLGAPLKGIPDEEIQEAVVKCFRQLIVPKAKELINDEQFGLTKGADFI